MKIIILAAGYATRLYPLTLNTPKPLLLLAGKPMLERLLEHLRGVNSNQAYLITNAKFAGTFEQWLGSYKDAPFPIKILNDGSMDESSKLGAIGDIGFVIEKENIEDDVMVVAGDNLFADSIKEFPEYGKNTEAPVVGITRARSLDEVKRMSSVKINIEEQITFFEEKPTQPEDTLISVALYFYPKKVLPKISEYLKEGNNPDQPGRLIEWLYKKMPVHTWQIPAPWVDVGTPESITLAEEYLKN